MSVRREPLRFIMLLLSNWRYLNNNVSLGAVNT